MSEAGDEPSEEIPEGDAPASVLYDVLESFGWQKDPAGDEFGTDLKWQRLDEKSGNFCSAYVPEFSGDLMIPFSTIAEIGQDLRLDQREFFKRIDDCFGPSSGSPQPS